MGADAFLLAVGLLAIAALFTYLGTKLTHGVGVMRPGKAVSVFLILIWCLSLMTFLFALLTYGLQLAQEHLLSRAPTNPITPVTEISAVATFIAILYLARRHGLKIALGSALVGTVAAPMIFELPFDLIVMGRTYPPIPPAPNLFRLLFFLPLFLVEISTFSLLTLSPLTRVSKYTLFSLTGVFVIFSVWALFGFAYPSDPALIILNDISKILSFVTAITLFVS